MALAALLPLAFMPEAWNSFAPVKADLFRVLAIAQLALFARGMAAIRLRGASPALVPAAAVVIASAVAIPVTPAREMVPLLDGVLGAGLFLVLLLGRNPGLSGRMLAAGAGAAGLAACYGLAQFAGFDLFEMRGSFALGAPPSTYGNPLFLADGLAAALPVALAGIAVGGSRLRTAALILAVFLSGGLLVTQARGAWLGAAAGTTVLVAWLLARRRSAVRAGLPWIAGLAAAALLLAAALSIPGPLNPGGMSAGKSAASLLSPLGGGFRGRFLLWQATALLVRERPLGGWGAGEFPRRYGDYQGKLMTEARFAGLEYHSTGHAHQDALQLAAERGIVGLGLMIWLVVCVAAVFIRETPRNWAGNSTPSPRRGEGAGEESSKGGGGIGVASPESLPGLPGSLTLSGQDSLSRYAGEGVIYRWGEEGVTRAAAAAGAAALLVDGLFNGPGHLQPTAPWLWLLLALVCGRNELGKNNLALSRGSGRGEGEGVGDLGRDTGIASTLTLSAGDSLSRSAGEGGSGKPGYGWKMHMTDALLVALVVFLALPFVRDLAGESYLRNAKLAVESGDFAAALRPALDSAVLCAGDRRHRFLLGQINYGLGRYSEAVECFMADTEENPGLASGWQNLGLSLLRVGRPEGARDAFRSALALNPGAVELPGLIREAERRVKRGEIR